MIDAQNLRLRPPTLADAQAALDLLVAGDVAEYGEPDTDLEDVLYDWGRIDLSRDAWLVFEPEQRLIGYAAVFQEEAGFSCDCYAHPAYASPALSATLLALCEARAQEQLGAAGRLSATAKRIVASVNAADKQAAEAAGFAVSRHHFRMQIEMESAPPRPVWPGGWTLRTMMPGRDDRPVYDFIQAAFARPGERPPPFEAWREFMMRPDHFESDLWFLLLRGEELIGAALCFDYVDLGWVRQLGVARAWRRRGLGSDLLRHTFAIFHQRGRRRVALGVNSENPNAYALYENLGMRRVRQYHEYRKELKTALI